MHSFQDRVQAVNEDRGHLCIGIDPRPERFPEGYDGANDLAAWCQTLIEATASTAAAFKPNLAFFLAHGADGITALETVADTVKAHDAFLILDGKFGDIGSTAERYAAFAEALGADAVTLNPYMGTDVLDPFLDRSLDAFVLARTTNPSAGEVQRAVVGTVVQAFTRQGSGFVAPGNDPDTARHVRQTAGGSPLLLPGVGTQGGSAADAARTAKGGPFLVAISRAIAHAEGSFPDACTKQAEQFRQEIDDALSP